MGYTLRYYQQQGVDKAVEFMKGNTKGNAIMVFPTGAGKSLIIANIAIAIGEPILVFQPSKEILEQNYAKCASYGLVRCGIYSASFGRRELEQITFCTIGSVMNHLGNLSGYRYAIIDECHCVNSKNSETQYNKMIKTLGVKVIGLTATPYRLHTNSFGTQLKFLTRTRPRIFSHVIHVTQIQELVQQGFLAKIEYYSLKKLNTDNLQVNSTGQDYTDQSIREEYRRSNFYGGIEEVVNRLRRVGRNRILVFTKFVEEALYLVSRIPNSAIVTGDSKQTPKAERERILREFKDGTIEVVCNVGVLTTGFDYPALDTVVMARPTRSLSLWYQIVGRAIRPYPNKRAWCVDLCGTYERYGAVENLELREDAYGWAVFDRLRNRQLTNVNL